MPGVLTPAERKLRARLAAHEMHARHDPLETTAEARRVFWEQFLDQVDPDRTLDEDERVRRAKSARAAYHARLEYQRLRGQRQEDAS